MIAMKTEMNKFVDDMQLLVAHNVFHALRALKLQPYELRVLVVKLNSITRSTYDDLIIQLDINKMPHFVYQLNY